MTTTKTETTTSSKRTSKPIGTVLDVEPGVSVERPDGSVVTVSGTQYVLDTAGDFVVGDKTFSATPAE